MESSQSMVPIQPTPLGFAVQLSTCRCTKTQLPPFLPQEARRGGPAAQPRHGPLHRDAGVAVGARRGAGEWGEVAAWVQGRVFWACGASGWWRAGWDGEYYCAALPQLRSLPAGPRVATALSIMRRVLLPHRS